MRLVSKVRASCRAGKASRGLSRRICRTASSREGAPISRCKAGPGAAAKSQQTAIAPSSSTKPRGTFQHAAQVFPGLLPRGAFDRRDDKVCPLGDGSIPGSPIKLAALPPDHVALTGQHVQDAVASRRHDLQREVHPQQPGNVVHLVLQLAMVSIAGETIMFAEPCLRMLIGILRIDGRMDAEITCRMFALHATDRQHDVGIGQEAIQEDWLAAFGGRQIGQVPSLGRIVGEQADPLGRRKRNSRRGLSMPAAPVGFAPQDRDSIGIDAGRHQGLDDGGRNLGNLRQPGTQHHDDAITRGGRLGQWGIFQRLLQRSGDRGGWIGQRHSLGRATLFQGHSRGKLQGDRRIGPITQNGHWGRLCK